MSFSQCGPVLPARLVPALDNADAEIEGLRHHVSHLEQALQSNRQIGLASGLLAARYKCTSDQSWALLVRLSQNLNEPIRRVAGVLVEAHNGRLASDDHDLAVRLAALLPDGGRAAQTRLAAHP